MLTDAHRKAAEDIESTILPLQAQPRTARVVIEKHGARLFKGLPLVAKPNITSI